MSSNLSVIGEFFYSWILKAVFKLRIENRRLEFTASTKREIRNILRRGRATTTNKCKTGNARAELLFCNLLVSLSLLKLPVKLVESCGLVVLIEFDGKTYISNVER